MKGRKVPPKGLVKEDVARAYRDAGSMNAAAELLGCSYATIKHHLHRTGVKVRKSNNAFKHVRTPDGIMRVRLRQSEEPKDFLPHRLNKEPR